MIMQDKMPTFSNDRLERMREEITQITNDLNNTSATRGNVSMEERYFVGVFLPLFAEGHSPAGATLDTWVSYAGGPNRRVNVVDSRGNLLFEVPALFDRSGVRPVFVNDGSRLIDILQMGKKMGAVHPLEGQRYLDSKLSERAILQQQTGADKLVLLEAWNAIFKRYDLPVIEVPGVTQATGEGIANKVGDDDDQEWDPL